MGTTHNTGVISLSKVFFSTFRYLGTDCSDAGDISGFLLTNLTFSNSAALNSRFHVR